MTQPLNPAGLPSSAPLESARTLPPRQPLSILAPDGRVNPNDADSARLAPSGALSAARLARASRALDEASLAAASLDRVSQSLEELRQALVGRSLNPESDQSSTAAHQKKIDDIIQTITTVADQVSRNTGVLISAVPGLGFHLSAVSDRVQTAKVRHANLQHGESLNVEIEVLASAQVAGFFLSFGNANLASTQGDFVIRIGTGGGVQTFTFASGAAVADIAAAIDAASNVTGVRAQLSSDTGIRLDVEEVGSHNFVSVRVLDDAGIGTANGIGVYELDPTNADIADPGHRHLFTHSTTRVDYGQDVRAYVNSIEAVSYGRKLTTAYDPTLGLDIYLTEEAASRTGTFHAFTIVARDPTLPLASQTANEAPPITRTTSTDTSAIQIDAIQSLRSILQSQDDESKLAALSRALNLITEQRFTLGELTSGLLRTIRAISGPTGSPPVDPAALRESIINTLSADPSAVPGALTGNTNPTGSLNRLN